MKTGFKLISTPECFYGKNLRLEKFKVMLGLFGVHIMKHNEDATEPRSPSSVSHTVL